MKLDDNVINILKNFAELNPSIIIKEGNKLETISQSKTILAEALLPVVFEKRFAIYNLQRFIKTLNLFDKPELIFEDKYVTIKENNKSIMYMYAEERTMVKSKVPDEKPDVTDLQVEFEVKSETIKEIEDVISILGIPNFIMEGDGKNILIKVEDIKNPTTDAYVMVVGETDKTFRAVFEITALGMMKDDYTVQICSSGIVKFVGNKVTYIVACDYRSKF